MSGHTPTSAVEALRALTVVVRKQMTAVAHAGINGVAWELREAVEAAEAALAASQEAPKAGDRLSRLAEYLDVWANECEGTEDADDGSFAVFVPHTLSGDFCDVLKDAAAALRAAPTPPASQGDAAPAGDAVREAVDDSEPTREERIATLKALSALDALSEAWADEIDLDNMCAKLAHADDVPAAIRAMVVQAYVEGAYAGRTSHRDAPPTPAADGNGGAVDCGCEPAYCRQRSDCRRDAARTKDTHP